MYNEFATWFTDLEAYKLGTTVGFFLGILCFFIIQAIVEYAIDLYNKKKKK